MAVRHQCPLGSVASHLIYADVRLHIPMTHRNGRYEGTRNAIEAVGFAEVDARPLNNSNKFISAEEPETNGSGMLRSYMYNLATDKEWKRKGVASALVEACEQFVLERHDSCVETRLYLRVRRCNDAAVGLYRKLGYTEMDPETIDLSTDDINSGSLEEGELILFAKDLPLDSECLLE